MTYIELNDEHNSIIDTKEIKSMSVDNLYYIKIQIIFVISKMMNKKA